MDVNAAICNWTLIKVPRQIGPPIGEIDDIQASMGDHAGYERAAGIGKNAQKGAK